MKSLLREGREWEIAPLPDDSLIQEIQAALPCSRPFAILLARRGGAEWPKLIDPGPGNFHSPLSLLGMDRAVARLVEAIDREEPVFIHGDFDVDGLCGAALLYRGLLPLFPKGLIKVDVGDRERGHGLSRAFVEKAVSEGFHLVVTVDCGISSVEEVALLREAGVDTIITDHHIPPPTLPPALAVVDPQQPGDPYPNRHLAGVGVAYKLIVALHERVGRAAPSALLDLVALGTIADLVPLAAESEVENRAIVREAFSLIGRQEGSSLGLRILMDKLSINPKKLTASDVGFLLAPKLNAANRTGDPKVAFLLLTTTLAERAEYLTEILLDYNRDREIAQDDLIAQAEEMMADEGVDPNRDGIIVLSGKYWNEGILGLVASHLTDRYRVPAIVLSQGDRVSRASCRSVDGFDIAACLERHSDLLLHYGGHRMAAGFSVLNENLPLLRQSLLQHVVERAPSLVAAPATIDGEVSLAQIDVRFYTNIRSLSPYGPGNPAPRLLLRKRVLRGPAPGRGKAPASQGAGRAERPRHPLHRLSHGSTHRHVRDARGASLVFRAGFDDWQGSVQVEAVDLVGD